MKNGMNLLLWTTHVTDEHFPLFAKLKKAGFDGVEIAALRGRRRPLQDASRKELNNHGLALHHRHRRRPGQPTRSAPTPRVRKAAVERHQVGHRDDGDPRRREPVRARTTRRWPSSPAPARPTTRRSAPPTCCARPPRTRKKAKVMLAIEYLNRFECYFLTTAADSPGPGQAGQSSATSARCTTPSTPTSRRRTSAAAIKALADSFVHVHISENDRGTPGTGQVHWDETFRPLREVEVRRLDGHRGVRPGPAGPGGGHARSGATCSPTPEEVYTQGLRFMKEKWAAANR